MKLADVQTVAVAKLTVFDREMREAQPGAAARRPGTAQGDFIPEGASDLRAAWTRSEGRLKMRWEVR